MHTSSFNLPCDCCGQHERVIITFFKSAWFLLSLVGGGILIAWHLNYMIIFNRLLLTEKRLFLFFAFNFLFVNPILHQALGNSVL